MRAADRESLRTQYAFQCGYCGIREVDAGAELTVDHFQPRSKGGSDALENLVYCCPACNEFKGDYWQPGSPRRILHPLRDNLTEHFILTDEGTLHPLTETGDLHIARLHLNRRELVLHRREQRALAEDRAAQRAALDRLLQLERRIEVLESQIGDSYMADE